LLNAFLTKHIAFRAEINSSFYILSAVGTNLLIIC